MTKCEEQYRVLHVIGQLDYGGAELLVSQIARLQVQRGWLVAVLVMGEGDVQLVRDLRCNGVEVYLMEARPYSPVAILRLRKLVIGQYWDVVHAHLFPALYWCALAVIGVGRRPKCVYTEHSTENRRRQHRALRHMESIVYRSYDEVVAVSPATRNSLQAWVPGLKVAVIENGVDVARFVPGAAPPRASYGLSDDDVVILCIGRLREEKNQSALIVALGFLPPVYKLLLVGDGPERSQLEDLCQRSGTGGRVHFLGALCDVVPILRAADIYVLPSLVEGFGLSALEAHLTGLPVVYSNVPGLRELFAGIGIAVDPLDPKSVSAGIKRAADSLPEFNSSAGVDHAMREKYSIERVEAQYLEVYCD